MVLHFHSIRWLQNKSEDMLMSAVIKKKKRLLFSSTILNKHVGMQRTEYLRMHDCRKARRFPRTRMFQGKSQLKMDSSESHKGAGGDPFLNEQCIRTSIHTVRKAAEVMTTLNNLVITKE